MRKSPKVLPHVPPALHGVVCPACLEEAGDAAFQWCRVVVIGSAAPV